MSRQELPKAYIPADAMDLRAQLKYVANSVWSIDRLVVVCEGWRDALSTSAIGRKLNVTKNAVVGKTHRLVALGILEARDNPIIYDGAPRSPKPPRAPPAPRHTIPALPSIAANPPLAIPRSAIPIARESRAVHVAVPVSMFDNRVYRPVVREVIPRPEPRAMTAKCLFPSWGNGTPTHIYCDAPTALGDSWCPSCRKKVFVRVRAFGEREVAA
jgi:GcrA cell cycle regulator